MKIFSCPGNLKRWLSTITLVGIITSLQSQSCFELRFSTETANAGDTIRIALTTRGFISVSSYQFAIEWNPADLQYIKRDQSNSLLDFQLFNAANTGQGKLLTLWSDASAMGITLPDDAVLFEIDFKVLATEPGLYPVKINPDGIPIFEAVKESAQSSYKLPFNHVWGGVRLDGMSNLAISSLCVEQAPCNAPAGAVNTVVEGGTPPYQFLWTGPNGYTSDESSPAGLALGYYELMVTDATGMSVQAAAELPFAPSTPIIIDTLSTKNAVCSQPNGCLALKAIGGTAPFSYHWETPGGATGSRCDLPPGYHKVTVTDALGCYGVAQFSVGNDSLLAVELDSINADCRFGQLGGVHLSANGTAPYTYTWSNGATSQHLTGLQPGWYIVTVSDATGCDAVSKVKVRDYGTFDWTMWLSKNCPNIWSTTPNSITIAGQSMQDRAAFPLELSWNTGTMQLTRSVDDEATYQTIGKMNGLPAGTYAVTITDAEGCSEVLETEFACYPALTVPIDDFGPRFFIYGAPGSSTSVDSCVVIDGKGGLSQLTEVRFSIKWPGNYMSFKELTIPYSFYGITQSNFTVHDNSIDFYWQKNGSSYLNDNWDLFKVCFKDHKWQDKVWVEFTSGQEEPTMNHATQGNLGFIGKGGRVFFEYDQQDDEFCDMNLELSSCAADGYARIQLAGQYCSGTYPNDYLGITGKQDFESFTGPDKILFAQPGEYDVYQTGNGSDQSRLYAYIPPYDLPATECVWPGDTDNNSLVNQYDMLYLGLGMGSEGSSRTDSAHQWQGADASDWMMQTPLRQVNFKNMDTDGNGVVEVADTVSILTHWGKAINPYQGSFFALPGPVSGENPELSVSLLAADTLNTGEPVEIPVLMGTPDFQVSDLLGLTFSISYDTSLLASGVRFQPSASWMGNPADDLICIQKEFPGQNRLDIALTRTDGTATGGFGEIGKLLLTFRQLLPGSLLPATFFTSNAIQMTPGEQMIALGVERNDFMIGEIATAGANGPVATENSIRLAPNPANTIVRLESPFTDMLMLEVCSASGEVLRLIEGGNSLRSVEISLENLPASVYFARIYTENGLVLKKFVIAR